jgi:hypothetical protein
MFMRGKSVIPYYTLCTANAIFREVDDDAATMMIEPDAES